MKKHEHKKAIELRKNGESINKIAKKLKVSTSSVSRWVKDIKLDKKQQNKLKSRTGPVGRTNSNISKKRKEMSEEEWLEYQQKRLRQKTLRWRQNNPEKYVNRDIEVKAELVKYKGGKCEICSYDKCIGAMQFHHKDPKEKEFTIGRHHRSLDKMKKEADKCMLLCSRCHDEIHWKQHVERRKERILEIRASGRVV